MLARPERSPEAYADAYVKRLEQAMLAAEEINETATRNWIQQSARELGIITALSFQMRNELRRLQFYMAGSIVLSALAVTGLAVLLMKGA